MPTSPHHRSQGTRGIPLITHILDMSSDSPSQSLDYTITSTSGRDGFLLLSVLVLFQIKRHERTWHESLNRLPEVSAQHRACPPANVHQGSAYSLQDCTPPPLMHMQIPVFTFKSWVEKDSQSKAAWEISLLIYISWKFLPLEKVYITVEAVCCQPSICAAVRHSFLPDLCHTDDYSDNSTRNFLVWSNSFYRWGYYS